MANGEALLVLPYSPIQARSHLKGLLFFFCILDYIIVSIWHYIYQFVTLPTLSLELLSHATKQIIKLIFSTTLLIGTFISCFPRCYEREGEIRGKSSIEDKVQINRRRFWFYLAVQCSLRLAVAKWDKTNWAGRGITNSWGYHAWRINHHSLDCLLGCCSTIVGSWSFSRPEITNSFVCVSQFFLKKKNSFTPSQIPISFFQI